MDASVSSPPPSPSPSPSPTALKPKFASWVDLWNGGPTSVDAVVHPDFRVHALLLDGGDGSAVRGADGLAAWIGRTRSIFPDLRLTVEVGPLVEGAFVAARWVADGTYAGGFPGATAEGGTTVSFGGADTLRMADGRFAESWLNCDTLSLLTQLKVR